MLQLSDEVDSYQHAAARKLAESGFVTLTFELRFWISRYARLS